MKPQKIHIWSLLLALVVSSCSVEDQNQYDEDLYSFTIQGNGNVVIGTEYLYAVDTTVEYNPIIDTEYGGTWDFMNHEEDYSDTVKVLDPSETPGFSHCENATYALQTNDLTFTYFGLSDDALNELGTYSEANVLLPAALRYDSPIQLLTFPMTEVSHTATNYTSSITIPFEMLMDEALSVYTDSLKIEKTGSYEVYSSGWGVCETGKGSFSVLRLNKLKTFVETISVLTNYPNEGTWVILDLETIVDHKILFQANEFHFPIAEFTLDSLDNITETRILK